MLSLTTASARSKVQEAVDALVEGRYHDLMSWASGPLQQQQRILSFTEGHEQQLQDRISGFLLLSCDRDVVGKPHQQEQEEHEEQERHILQWLKEMRSSRSQNHGHNVVMDNCCETSPVFQRSFDSEVDVEVEKQTTTLRRTLVLVLVGASAQLLNHSVGLVLVVEDEKEAHWKFHGVVCVAGSEESLVSKGWRRMQEDTRQSLSSMTATAAPVASTTYRIQEQQYQKAAGKYCDEEDDDSDDDYWGQYGDPDSDHDDSVSDETSNDSSPTEMVSSPSSSSADTTFSPASTYYSPSTTGAMKSSTAISMKANTIFAIASTTSFTSGPNICRWEEVDEVDEDDDDEYWGKYGDHDELEPEPKPKQQQHRGQGLDSEAPSKVSSHANHDNTKNIYDMGAERHKIDPAVPTAQKEDLCISSEAALPDSAFPTLAALVPVVPEPGQVDPTALTLRLMNLIVHHTDSTGYSGAAGARRYQQFYLHDEDDDIDDQLADNEETTDDNTSSRSRTRGGFLIRLDSRLQQYHDSAAATPLESEHQRHTDHTYDKDEQREGEGGVGTQESSTLFSAPALAPKFHSHPNNTNIKDSEAGSCTSPPYSSSQSRFESQSLSSTISTSGSLPPAPASLPNPSISSFPPPPQHLPHFTDRRQQQQLEQQEQHQLLEQQQNQRESLSPSS
ncbi:hypothetical protein F5H01DRAFT_412624 [Linnemannia elongata]|nr:hypothetical protein F5H01DRAFT_412624 [Linnemannia elongata]